ncbi:MAG: extracellular solute-binding protein [Lachnospiraceae bacterium]|nr:extracellular solute-binding protein [Lachnospiraceae bacterium]
MMKKVMNQKGRKYLAVFLLLFCLTAVVCAVVSWYHTKTGEDIAAPEPMVEELFGNKKSAFGNVTAPASFDWKQCDGTTLDFIVENNINANILSKECAKFTEVTGINVRFRNVDFETMTDQINMEFISQAGQYDLIYIDPYQTLPRFSDSLEDLNYFEKNEEYPHIVGGLESFSEEQVKICSYYLDEDKLCAVPFDSTTMILYYRKDIFEKYAEKMTADLGYVPSPGSREFTWERYLEVADWLEKNVSREELQYPCVTMAAHHNSSYVEFSSIMSAYGGDYFEDEDVSLLGTGSEMEIQSNSEGFVKALAVYQKLTRQTTKQSGRLNWDQSAELFKKGKVGMMVNWDENAAMIENENDSAVAGKTGYSVLPYGDSKSANIYGGSGVGINKYISEGHKLASWMFIVWCTSPEIQILTFLEKEGGNMPTRSSLLHLIAAQYMMILPQAPAVINAQKQSYVYYRPKLEAEYEFEKMMQENLEKLLLEEVTPEEVGENIRTEWMAVRQEHLSENVLPSL